MKTLESQAKRAASPASEGDESQAKRAASPPASEGWEFGRPGYGLTRMLPGVGFDEAEARTRAALAAEGFGVLTTIDVAGTLGAKLGVVLPRYAVLGACNPALAHRALVREPAIGLMLPCNVVVAEQEGGVVVSIADPRAMLGVAAASLGDVAEEARSRLERALAAC